MQFIFWPLQNLGKYTLQNLIVNLDYIHFVLFMHDQLCVSDEFTVVFYDILYLVFI